MIIASNIPFSFKSGEWTASYSIKSTGTSGPVGDQGPCDQRGSIRVGVNTLSVGDGFDIFLPEFNTTTLLSIIPKFTVGQTINITAEITFPSGSVRDHRPF